MQDQIFSVSEINQEIKFYLENEVGSIAVMGEISNLSKPQSGHLYFTLKDSKAQLRAVFFKTYHSFLKINFKDGQQVLAKGKLSLYEPRGDYQLIVYSLMETGEGDLFRQFELLKQKLALQGLFAQERKKTIPTFPTCIGIITSKNAAALQDILTTLARRYPLATIRIYHSEVQGKEAPWQLLKAIQKANEDNEVDVILLARGGGSIEDLWAFNDEQLALGISKSAIPIVTGIGHETDFTIADFVADLRAATPTAAAEAVTPNHITLLASLLNLKERLVSLTSRLTTYQTIMLKNQMKRMLSPQQLVSKHWQTLDFLNKQLIVALQHVLLQKKNHINILLTRLSAKNPKTILEQSQSNLTLLRSKLITLIDERHYRWQRLLKDYLSTLHVVSPLATLERGYSIARLGSKIIRNSSEIQLKDLILIRLAKGSLSCKVIDKEEEEIKVIA